MATRAIVAIRDEDTYEFISVYLHNGDFDFTSRCLFEHYNSKEKVYELIKQGNIESLGVNIGVKVEQPKYGSQRFQNMLDGIKNDPPQCVFYRRDRNYKDTGPRTYNSLQEIDEKYLDIVFIYAFIENRWIAFKSEYLQFQVDLNEYFAACPDEAAA